MIKLRSCLRRKVTKSYYNRTVRDFNFVLGNALGQKADVHSYTFDADEKNVYGIPYPAESLTGTGSVEGYAVRCISAEWVVKFHTQYEPGEKDFKDVYAVCAKFGIAVSAPKAGGLTGKWNHRLVFVTIEGQTPL